MNAITSDVSARLKLIALDRLGLLATPAGESTPTGATAVLAELAHAGIGVTNPDAVTDGLAAHVPTIVNHVQHRRGKRGTFTPLFSGFPDQLPSFDIGWVRMLLGAARIFAHVEGSFEPGESGAIFVGDKVLRDAMDFSGIGWWPASSVPQDVEQTLLDRAVEEIKPADSRVEWMKVRVVCESGLDEHLRSYMAACFASAASLRDDVKVDLEFLARHYGVEDIDTTGVRFRENRALLMKLAWEINPNQLKQLLATPDDILRVFAGLTGTDVSLTDTVRFPRLSRPQRRAVVNALEATDRLGDVFRRRGLWLALDRGLHVGEFTAPRTQETFSRLRESRHDTTSFGSRFEMALGSDYPAAVKLASTEAPGVLARSLRRLASLAGNDQQHQTSLIEAMKSGADRVPLRVLLAARAQMADNGATYPRVAFTKTGTLMTIGNQPGHLAIGDEFRDELVGVLDEAIAEQVAAKGTWEGEKVFIDPALDRVLLPEQLRSTAQGLVQAERGTRLPLGDAPVVRLFVHWREDKDQYGADLDLSCLALNEKFEPVGQVSWTNLANGAMTHSGDLTSAPAGAQEFIDINLDAARKHGASHGWRYLVPTVLRYAGPSFAQLAEAHVGWMLREECSSDRRTFDPATVVNAFALTGGKRTAVPILVDLDTSEVLYTDVYLNGSPHATVERDGQGISAATAAVDARRHIKATVADLAAMHVKYRGATVVDSRTEATITFGFDPESTYQALRPERILADLL